MAQWTHKRNHTGFFGGSGTGKTHLALVLLCNAPSDCVFIFDPENEFSEKLNIHPALTPEGIDAAIETGWVCYDPAIMYEDDHEEALVFFCKVVMAYAKENKGTKKFVVDELGSYITGHKIPKPLKSIIQTGRRYGIDCVFLGQAPNELHNTVRNQLTTTFCFRLEDDNALEFPLARGYKEAELRALPDYQWICRDNLGNEDRFDE